MLLCISAIPVAFLLALTAEVFSMQHPARVPTPGFFLSFELVPDDWSWYFRPLVMIGVESTLCFGFISALFIGFNKIRRRSAEYE